LNGCVAGSNVCPLKRIFAILRPLESIESRTDGVTGAIERHSDTVDLSAVPGALNLARDLVKLFLNHVTFSVEVYALNGDRLRPLPG
jgi:hypothetical protein